MNWLAKVAAFKLLSALPGGAGLYRYSQERITRSLVPTRARVTQKLDIGLQYWEWLQASHFTNGSPPGSHLDLGAGWHPTVPLLYYSLGLDRQYLFDVSPLLTRELVDETVKVFLEIVNDPKWPHRSRLRRLPKANASASLSWPDYLKEMGITYHAPYEGVDQEIAGTVDIATCTQVLYYLGWDTLTHICSQVHRSLRTGGKFLATIHLKDVNATAKNGLSIYNHLKFSPAAWDKWINSSLMTCNRYKARDYRRLLEQAGFKIVHFDVEGPTAADLQELNRIPIHACFADYSREELGAKHLFFVAEKI